MSSSATEIQVPLAGHVTVSDDALTVELGDGRTLAVPLGWYPSALARERRRAKSMATHRKRSGHSLAGSRRGHPHRGTPSRPAIGREPRVIEEMARGIGCLPRVEQSGPPTVSSQSFAIETSEPGRMNLCGVFEARGATTSLRLLPPPWFPSLNPQDPSHETACFAQSISRENSSPVRPPGQRSAHSNSATLPSRPAATRSRSRLSAAAAEARAPRPMRSATAPTATSS